VGQVRTWWQSFKSSFQLCYCYDLKTIHLMCTLCMTGTQLLCMQQKWRYSVSNLGV